MKGCVADVLSISEGEGVIVRGELLSLTNFLQPVAVSGSIGYRWIQCLHLCVWADRFW